MSEEEATSDPPLSRESCALAWCTTAHGATLHESDEDHRSDGRSLALVARRDIASPPDRFEVEVGLLRRRGDAQTWLVVEDGRHVHVEITLDSARELVCAVRADPAVARELGLGARRV